MPTHKSFGPSGSASYALNMTDAGPVSGMTAAAVVIAFAAQYLAPYVGGQEAAVALLTGLATLGWRLLQNYRK